MSRPGKWRVYAQHDCLQLIGPIYGRDHIVAAMNFKVCPGCGQPCGLHERISWARVVARKVSDTVWFRPLTWGRWHFEYKLKGHLEDKYDYRRYMTNSRTGAQDETRPNSHGSGAIPVLASK